ncbi:MAG: hypothetical protein Kow0069_29320 [Promethearchaeota archaeon]
MGSRVHAEQYQIRVNVRPNDSKFYVFDLNASEPFWANVTSTFGGDFDLYLYNFRPIDTYTKPADARTYDDGPSPNASVHYVSPRQQVCYLHVHLNSSKPDTYVLKASKPLTAYFIPFLPGYSVPLVVLASLGGVGALAGALARRRSPPGRRVRAA